MRKAIRMCLMVLATGLATLNLTALRAAELPVPSIAVSQTTEDGKRLIVATVTVDGKPVEDVPVQFQIRRTFGNLMLGTEKTLDDGTAALPYPADLPADSSGALHVLATVTADAKHAAAQAEQLFSAARTPADRSFPRALWAPHAPVLLIVVISSLFVGTWMSYAWVIVQALRLRTKGRA